MAMEEIAARNHAIDVVKIALQSTALHLKGVPASINDAERYATADAKYISTLIKELTKALQE